MPTKHIIMFCITASILILTPGPNFVYVLTRGATQGRRPALLAALGLGCGVMLHTTLAGLGVAALIRSSYLAFQAIKYGSCLYLIYLGVKTLANHGQAFALDHSVPSRGETIIWQSIVASMTNPKTILFFLGFLPQFINIDASHATPQLLLLGTIYMLLTVLIYGAVACFAGAIRRWLCMRAEVAAHLHWVSGTCFIGLGAWAGLPGSHFEPILV